MMTLKIITIILFILFVVLGCYIIYQCGNADDYVDRV